MGACVTCQVVKDQEHRVGVEPTSPRYEGGIFAARRAVLKNGQCLSVGPVGIEPTSPGLRDRNITLSATVPSISSGGRNRTSNHRLNRPQPYRLATPDYVSQNGRT